MALKSTSLHAGIAHFLTIGGCTAGLPGKGRQQFALAFFQPAIGFPVCCVCKCRVRKRISSHLLFPCPSTKLIPESTVRVSSKCLPGPKFAPTVVCGAFTISAVPGCTHLPDAPRGCPSSTFIPVTCRVDEVAQRQAECPMLHGQEHTG